MNVLDPINKHAIRDLLGKGWLTHDGMWFHHACQAMGIETANQLNKAAIKSLAPIEVKRVRQILDRGDGDLMSLIDLKTFMSDALELTLPASVFRKLHFISPCENTLHWEWEPGECFAYKGIKMMGIIDEYSCGVMYRIECWLEALGIDFRMHPKPDKCLMHATGTCAGDIRIIPEEPSP